MIILNKVGFILSYGVDEVAAVSIRYECICGTHIRLPERAAGRRARCTSCGAVFNVPRSGQCVPAAKREAPPQDPVTEVGLLAPSPMGVDGGPMSPATRPVAVARQTRNTIGEDKSSFWEDAAWSFVFFLNTANLSVLITVSLVQLLLVGLQFVPFLGMLGWVLSLLFWMWLCSFYFHVVLETAAGEDELSTAGFSDIMEELIRPCLRFLICGAIALGPAYLVAVSGIAKEDEVPWHAVIPVGAAGLFLWPVMILGTAVGGGLPLRSIHLLILTVIKTPLAYLSVCLLVGVAIVSASVSTMGMDGLLTRLFGRHPPLSLVAISVVLGGVVQTYAWIVAMRVIGLYYRHFKSRFPWRAE